jgi:hypothetical protein
MHAEFPPLQWGTSYMANVDLEVEDLHHCLRVVAFNPLVAQDMRPELCSWDLFEKYRKAPKDWSKGRTGKGSPHMQFANADTDEKLIAFVRKFGPVVASSVSEVSRPQRDVPPFREAHQDWNELRNERLLYQSVLTLISELAQERRGDVLRRCITTIADKVSDWPRQWQRELDLMNPDKPHWQFDEEALKRIHDLKSWPERPSIGERIGGGTKAMTTKASQAGHSVICELLNAFRPLVYRWRDRPIEGPHWDVRYGIRPVLYFILSREYVTGDGVAVCANSQCRELFEIERAGERFCTAECSRRQRQREYWEKRGSRMREKRLRAAATRLRRTG